MTKDIENDNIIGMLDFTLIDSGEDFELLCEDLLRQKGFVIQKRSSRGADFGADIIAEMTTTDSLGFVQIIRVLVECKHYAKSNRSVREDQLGSIIEKTVSNNCNRYLLITSTVPSTNVENILKQISNNPTIKIGAAFWAKNDLDRTVSEFPNLVKKYFVEKGKNNESTAAGDLPKFIINIHEHPDFSDELNNVINIWNNCQTHVLFKLIKPSHDHERKLLTAGELDDQDAAIIANEIRREAGYSSDDGIIQFCEKRLFSQGYYQLFAAGTKHSETPPNTATISLNAMRGLATGNDKSNIILSMLLSSILHVTAEGIGLESHEDTRKCIMDFDNNMSDIFFAVAEGPSFCERCAKQLQRVGSSFLVQLSIETKKYLETVINSDSTIKHKLSLREKRSKEYGDDYTYDIALSFAGEDRAIAGQLAEKLKSVGIKVFYDHDEASLLWGEDLYSYLSELYRIRSRYCVMLLSKHYVKKSWTNHERMAAQERAFKENRPYILPIRIDDTEVPGILSTTGYLHLERNGIDNIVSILKSKIL